MIYSVFDWNRDPARSGHYVYFEGQGEGLGIRPKPRKIWGDNRGHKLEELLPVLPVGSRPIGRGSAPRGRIAILNDTLRASLGDVSSVPNPWGLIATWGVVIFGGYYIARAVGQWAAQRGLLR